jgi:hypothetical protein
VTGPRSEPWSCRASATSLAASGVRWVPAAQAIAPDPVLVLRNGNALYEDADGPRSFGDLPIGAGAMIELAAWRVTEQLGTSAGPRIHQFAIAQCQKLSSRREVHHGSTWAPVALSNGMSKRQQPSSLELAPPNSHEPVLARIQRCQ